MNSRRNIIIGAILLVVMTFVLTAGGALYLFDQMVPDVNGALKLMRAMDVVKSRYIEVVTPETLMNGAIKGMVNSLGDPYSIYMDAKMYKEFRMETEGSFSGVGIVISVKDLGVGISVEDQAKLFQEFQRVGDRSVAPGTGLGLWLTAALIKAHGGRIWVESQVGVGSTFFVALPA